MSTQFTNRQWRLPNNENKDKQSSYSMDFDSASSDYITAGLLSEYIPLSAPTSFTVSAWIKTTDIGGIEKGVIGSASTSLSSGLNFTIYNGEIIFGVVTSWATSRIITTNASVNDGNWHHVVGTYNSEGDSSGNTLYLYIDDTQVGSNTGNRGVYPFANNPLFIGARGQGANASGYFNGQIDGVSIYNYPLSSSQITTLYGSSSTGIGNPMSLSPKPVAFYQLGDKSAFNGANYLVPNIAAQEDDGDIVVSYSPFALDFDSASSDYIDCGSFSALNSGTAVTVSLWFKSSTYSTDGRAISNNTIEIYQASSAYSNTQGRFYYRLRGNYGNSFAVLGGTLLSGVGNLVDGNWHHLCITFDNSTTTAIVYEDGVQLITDTSVSGTLNSASSNLYIGSDSASSNFIDGSISNISIWNTNLTSSQVSEIYSEGIPQNLNNHSAVSSLVSWWQLGSNSSFNTNWTVLDEKGSNNGTSVNMTEADIVDGVGSSANGVSSGMSDNIVGSAPFSDANSLSYNMDVLDRVEDTPN